MSNSNLDGRAYATLVTAFETETGEARLIKLYYYKHVPWEIHFIGATLIYPVARKLLHTSLIERRNAGFHRVLVSPPNWNNYITINFEGYALNLPAADVRRVLLASYEIVDPEQELTEKFLDLVVKGLYNKKWIPRYFE
jgi:hypothetical protein